MEDNKNPKNDNKPAGDVIHVVTAYLEHLMDIFEIGIAVIVALGFIASVYPLVRELPLLASLSTGTESYRHFLENALDLVIGIEFIKMLVKHTPGSVVEVLLFALSRHMVLEGGSAKENLLTVCAIAVIFAIRRFLYIESFEFVDEDNSDDWLSDWKAIRHRGRENVKQAVGNAKARKTERKSERKAGKYDRREKRDNSGAAASGNSKAAGSTANRPVETDNFKEVMDGTYEVQEE